MSRRFVWLLALILVFGLAGGSETNQPAATEFQSLHKELSRISDSRAVTFLPNGDGSFRVVLRALPPVGSTGNPVDGGTYITGQTGTLECQQILVFSTYYKYFPGYDAVCHWQDYGLWTYQYARGTCEWDLSPLPDDMVIDSVYCRSYATSLTNTVTKVDLYQMANRPSTTSNAQTLYNDAGDGEIFGTYQPITDVPGWYSVKFTDAGRDEIQSRLTSGDWFAIGYTGAGSGNPWQIRFINVENWPELVFFFSGLDIASDAVLSPTGTIRVNVPVTPRVRVQHISGTSAVCDLELRVYKGDSLVHSQKKIGVVLNSEETREVDFNIAWTPQDTGEHRVVFWHTLTPDEEPGNDTAELVFRVRPVDVGAAGIIVPADGAEYEFGEPIVPKALVSNYTDDAETSVPVRMRIYTSGGQEVWSALQTVDLDANETEKPVEFGLVEPQLAAGYYAVTCSTELLPDWKPENNRYPPSGTHTFVVLNRVPVTTSIAPNEKQAGEPGFVLTVYGSNFVYNSVVRFEGSDRPTTYVDENTLQAQISADDIKFGGTFSITVFNPAPGGGTSNAQVLTVYNRVPVTTGIIPAEKEVGESEFVLTVSGEFFVPGAVVRWNGSNRYTEYVNGTTLEAIILESDLSTAGLFSVDVVNPAPGGGTSNVQTFTVKTPVPNLTQIEPTEGTQGQAGLEIVFTGGGFIPDVTQVGFGPGNGITVNSVTVTSPEELIANIDIAADATVGKWDVSVSNPGPGGGVAVLAEGFEVKEPTLQDFSLLAPEDGAVDLPVTGLVFQWEDANPGDAASYEVWLGLPGELVKVKEGLTEPSWTYDLAEPLLPNTAYSWNVKAVLESDGEKWALNGPFGFTIADVPPAPTNLSPDQEEDVARSGMLTWDPFLVYGAPVDSYVVWLGAGTPERYGNAGKNTQYPYSGLAGSTTYSWYVAAWGPGGVTLSATAQFTTQVETPAWEKGWVAVKSLPQEPTTTKAPKAGAWLVTGPDNAGSGKVIYAAKGNKTSDFYKYYPEKDSWAILGAIPDVEPATGKAKLVSKGSRAVTDGKDYLYVLKGNGTQGFWRYRVEDGKWDTLTRVPVKIKGGNDMAYVKRGGKEYLYLLAGGKTAFYRFDVERGEWMMLDSAPYGGNKKKYGAGSFLVYDKGSYLYAHQANVVGDSFHYMFRYDLAKDSWQTTALRGLPLYGTEAGKLNKKKKSKDGAGAVWYAGRIYAVKGGGSQNFYRYNPVGDSWTALDTIPRTGASGTKGVVKAGGALANWGDAFFLLKGNNTYEFWRYVQPVFQVASAQPSRRDGVQTQGQKRAVVLRVAPNPIASGFAVLRLEGYRGTRAQVRVYDAVGRCVVSRPVEVRSLQQGVVLDLRHLSSGVYLVRLDGAGLAVAQKLVVQK